MDTLKDAWRHGITTVQREYALQSPQIRAHLRELAGAIMAAKRNLYAVSAAVEASGLCADCRGACCARGKYHFSVVDLLVYLATDTPLFDPRFDQDVCPFLGGDACLMPPELRPLTCITFNCEQIDALLPPLERTRFAVQEDQLRELYREVEAIFKTRLSGGLLHYSEKSLAEGRGILLAS